MGKMDRITAYNYYSDFWRNHSLKEIDFKGKNWNYIKSLMGFYTSFVDRLKEELPDTANWKGEILLINSKDDNDTIDKYEELIAAYPGAKTHLFESGAHHTPLLFPEEFTKIISEFAN